MPERGGNDRIIQDSQNIIFGALEEYVSTGNFDEYRKAIATKYKGIILNKEIHVSIINDLIDYFNSLGFYIKDLTFSPITGGDGNIEYLAYVSNKVKENKRLDVKKIVTNAFKNNK